MQDTAQLRDKLIAGQNEATKGYKKFAQAQYYGKSPQITLACRQLDEGAILRGVEAFSGCPLSLERYAESTAEHRDTSQQARCH